MTYTEPLLAFFFAIALIGLIRPRQRWGVRFVWIGFGGLLATTWPPSAWLFSRPLEIWYPVRPFSSTAPAQAIVVLSSGTEPPHSFRPFAMPNNETYQRCEFGAWLYHRWRALPVLACGGGGGKVRPPVSVVMRELLKRAGVPAAMIWTEERSRSTYENAVFGAQILRQHGISSVALVVDATSMPRASACFRRAGIQVIPAPSDFFRKPSATPEDLLPGWRAVQQNELTLHETLGLAWYWLRGWV